MSDEELIRKAAEALHNYFQRNQPDNLKMLFVELHPDAQAAFERRARVCLQVFYEHTRSQPREQAPPKCPDCSAEMKLTGTALVFFTCPSCGATR
jgi:tRNA(Ile2) C34 agmatinyltransferase TiaS